MMKLKGARSSDADMTWRRADGTMGEYRGELIELGMGIPRRKGSFGIRRAVFDLAFGYVSGFPVRDILPFAFRSLFPGRRRVHVTAPKHPTRVWGERRGLGWITGPESMARVLARPN